MDITYDDICNYTDRILSDTGMFVSLHGDFMGNFRLARYRKENRK